MVSNPNARSIQPLLWTLGLILLLALAAGGGYQYASLAARKASVTALVPGDALPEGTRSAPTALPAGPVDPSPLHSATARIDLHEEEGLVALYFASGQVELPRNAANTLGLIVKGVAAGQSALIRSYNSAASDAAQTLQRVFAVHNLLVSVGISEHKIQRREVRQAPAEAQEPGFERVDIVLESG